MRRGGGPPPSWVVCRCRSAWLLLLWASRESLPFSPSTPIERHSKGLRPYAARLRRCPGPPMDRHKVDTELDRAYQQQCVRCPPVQAVLPTKEGHPHWGAPWCGCGYRCGALTCGWMSTTHAWWPKSVGMLIAEATLIGVLTAVAPWAGRRGRGRTSPWRRWSLSRPCGRAIRRSGGTPAAHRKPSRQPFRHPHAPTPAGPAVSLHSAHSRLSDLAPPTFSPASAAWPAGTLTKHPHASRRRRPRPSHRRSPRTALCRARQP